MSCADELARLLSRANPDEGVRCILQRGVTRSQTLVSYTDGGPFVYTIQEAGVLVQLAADYLRRSTERYGYVALERSALSLVARLDSSAGPPEAYLIARSVYNLAADGHLGREFGEFVDFKGFGVEVDIELLHLDQVSEEMERLVRAMPARGPSPLDRLAEWQLASKASKDGKVYDRDYVFQTMCDNQNATSMPDQASISVYSRQASLASLAMLRSLDIEHGTGTMFMEPFVTRPDDTKADATTLGSYTTLGNEARGPKSGITVAFPAADPICVYGATEHWLLAGNERVWVHLHRRKYVFAAHGVTIPNAMGGAFALLREIYAPVSGAGSGSVSVSVSGGAVSGNPQESASRAWRARGSLAMYTWHVPLILSRIREACSAVVIVESKGDLRPDDHAMCGVLVLGAVDGSRRKATLLVRGIDSDASFDARHRAALSKMQRGYDLAIERVEVPRQNDTQGAEGSCTVHALMHALFLVDVHREALGAGDVDKLREALQQAAPVEYALACMRALSLAPDAGSLEEYACGDGNALRAYVEPTGGLVLTTVDAFGVAQKLESAVVRTCVGAFSKHLRSMYGEKGVNALAPFKWWSEGPSAESECRLVVGGATIPVGCSAATVTLADHPCLDSWASEWGEIPRLQAFGLAKGSVTGDSPMCSIVEVHNKADGDCLLQALGFYLCVSRDGWSSTADEMRKAILDDVEARLMNVSADFEVDRDTARDARYKEEEDERWAAKQSDGTEKALAKYVFTRRRNGADLGNLEIDALSRVYGTNICLWSTPNGGVNLVHKTSPEDVRDHNGPIADFGTCAHLRYYATGHYTLLALLDGTATDFGRKLRRYV